MDKIQNLPSETLQREFENNPLKILETIRNEKEQAIPEIESQKGQKENVNMQIKEGESLSPHIINNKIEDSKTNDLDTSFDMDKNGKLSQKEMNRIKNSSINNINNINNINTMNNINFNNALINYNPNINNNNNIIVNHLNIFLNFNANNNNDSNLYVNKN